MKSNKTSKTTNLKMMQAKKRVTPTHLKVQEGVKKRPTHLKISDPGTRPQPQARRRPIPRRPVDPDIKRRTQLQLLGNKIYAAKNIDVILIDLRDEITQFFESERITVYMFDGMKRELVSKVKTGSEVSEIRIPVGVSSIVGFASHKQKLINIKNVYDDKELAAIDPNLKFDKSWDKKANFTTKQVLAVPIFFQKYLMGAIQIINRKDDQPYSPVNEGAAIDLAKMIGIGLYKQKRSARQANNKFNSLLQKHLINPKELSKAFADAERNKQPIETILMENHSISKADLGKALADYYEVPFVEFNENVPVPIKLLKGLKVPFLKKNLWVPLRSEGGKIIILVDEPQNFQKIGEIKSVFTSAPLEFSVGLAQDINDFIDFFTGRKSKSVDPKDFDIDALSDELLQGVDDDTDSEDEEDLVSEESGAVVKLVNKIILDAYKNDVSDIHIEPQPGKGGITVRTRIDGACRKYPMIIPYTYNNAVVSRIKIMSGLDIAERRIPQDGKIAFKKYGGLNIELRVATVPTQGQLEDIVMRILAAGEPIPLKNMGFTDLNYKNLVNIVEKPYGIIFVCGPTGSGKTTTLHSILKHINITETKIWTAEDPVEITQKGLRQVQVKPKIGFTFATAMRAFLRADPDVIMVGEMRDKETTSIGIEASLTGHLVFSTLHTNSAPESVTRLLDMGMDPFNFADAVLGILAQRLIRTLCKDCKAEFNPSQEQYDELRRLYGEEHFEQLLLPKYPLNKDLVLYKPEGCQKCNGTGYRGRMGIHELLVGTDEQKKLIQTQGRVEELRDQAMKDGMTTLMQDGIEKVFMGRADLVQVRKVCIA